MCDITHGYVNPFPLSFIIFTRCHYSAIRYEGVEGYFKVDVEKIKKVTLFEFHYVYYNKFIILVEYNY